MNASASSASTPHLCRDQFPKLANEQVPANDFAVLNFPPNETPAGWRSGYYRLDSDLTKLNESLLALSR